MLINKPSEYLQQNTPFFVRSFLKTTIAFLFLFSSVIFGQTTVDRIYTDWNGYFTSNGPSSVAANQPNTENNLLAFSWNGKTYATGANNAVLTANSVSFEDSRFRALKIQSLSSDSGSYYLQGSMIDGSLTNRILTPALSGSVSTPAELASRLTDGINGLALGTGVANIKSSVPSEFKVGTNNIQLGGIGDGIPDIVVTQVAQPNSTVDSFKFVDIHGAIVGNAVSVAFTSIPVMGTYRLDLFNSGNGAPASGFSANDTREIRLLAMDMISFGITAANAPNVDRFVVTFSGSSDCAFIAFNANSLKKAELSLVKKATVTGCAAAGDIINYTFEVTNTGDVPITNVTVTDPMTGLVISGVQGSTLAAGAAVTLTGAYTITAADVTAGQVTNSAKVTGLDPSLNTVEDISGQAINDDIATVVYLSPAPTGAASQTFCSTSSPTVADLSATGPAIKWYAHASGGSALAAATPLVNGTHYYATQTVGGCESRSRLNVTATVNTVLSAVSITPNTVQNICLSGTGTALSVAETGGGVISGRQWGVRSVSGGAITPLTGQTASSYTPSSADLGFGAWYLVCTSTSACGTPITSNEVRINIFASTVAGTLSPANTNVCSGVYNSSILTLSGYTGSIIRWESSTDNFATAGTPIANTGNTQVIGTHTTDTYYRAVVQNGNCTLEYSNSVKITVFAVMSSPGGISVDGSAPYPPSGSGISHCAGTSTVFSIAPVANAGSYTWVIPSGWTVVSGQGTTTLTAITGNNSQSANIEVYASNTGCGDTNRSYLYLYLNPSTAPVVSLIQPSCAVTTGTVTVTSPAPASGITYTLTGTNPISAPVTNATGVFTGLTAGVYDVIVNNGTYVSAIPKVLTPLTSCASATSVTMNALVTKTWNGSWSPAGAPGSNDFVVINADYSVSSSGDINACSLIVNPGYKVTVEAGKFVIIQNNLTVDGTLDILDKGSLVMVNDAGTINGAGTTNVHRITTPFKKNDYVYWSTPVTTSPISSAVFPSWRTGYAYEYNNAWVTASTMTPAKGYIVMVPNPTTDPNGNISEVVFNGTVNNGVQKITGVVPDRAYLLGNPYPSALDAEAFLDYNAGVLGGTLYFWTHNTAIQLASNIPGTAGSGVYAYTSDDYASYNAVGGVSVGSGSGAISGGAVPSGKIGSGQGFFATSNATIIGTNEVVFNNAMRLSPTGVVLDNSQFFKTKNPKAKTAKTIEKHRIWLNLSNDKGAFKQTLIGYVTGATNNDDSRFDGKTLDGNKFVDFYSVNQNKNLVIQGRALPFDDQDEVPLGYKTAVDGSFTISIDQADGLLVNQTVFLEDKLTNTVFNLKNGDYNFTTAKGTFNDRFVLKYIDKTLNTDDFTAPENEVIVSVKNKQIKINSFIEAIEKVVIYDLSGKQIYKKEQINSKELNVANFIPADQVLIVKTTLQNGVITTNKIVF